MFAKFNLSRLPGFAALGIVVAVLGGCAEGMPDQGQATTSLDANHEMSILTRHEHGNARVATAAASSDATFDSRALDGHGHRFASNLH